MGKSTYKSPGHYVGQELTQALRRTAERVSYDDVVPQQHARATSGKPRTDEKVRNLKK